MAGWANLDLLGARLVVLARRVDAAHLLPLLPDLLVHDLHLPVELLRTAGRGAGGGLEPRRRRRALCEGHNVWPEARAVRGRRPTSIRLFSSSIFRVYMSPVSCSLAICACADTLSYSFACLRSTCSSSLSCSLSFFSLSMVALRAGAASGRQMVLVRWTHAASHGPWTRAPLLPQVVLAILRQGLVVAVDRAVLLLQVGQIAVDRIL